MEKSNMLKWLKNISVLAVAAVLAACRPQSAAPEETAAQAASAPLGAQENAPQQAYQCHDGLTASVRYFDSNGQAAAEIRFDAQTFTLPYNREESGEDAAAFGDGTHIWRIDHAGGGDFSRAENGFLFRRVQQKVGSEVLETDEIMAKNCMPVR